MVSLADTCEQVLSTDVPALFVDTCSLLDIIRSPLRSRHLAGCIQGAVELRQLLSNIPPRCIMVTASFVDWEWHDNVQATTDALQKHLETLDELAAEFHDSCRSIGLGLSFGRPAYRNAPLADGLHRLSRNLLDLAIKMDAHDDTNRRAFQRAIARRPPARRRGEMKDCVIIEEYLEVCRQLRTAGFQKELVFCTSNVADYCHGKHPHPELRPEFAAVGLSFTRTIPWAVHEIKK